MDIKTINEKLLQGELNQPGVFPHLDRLKNAPFIFRIDFGLDKLPTEPGILLIRGARQYGKSTWLEQQIKLNIEEYGAGTAFYLNGDNISDIDTLEQAVTDLCNAYPKNAAVRRLFIDEITSIPRWEIALKRLADRGTLNSVLVITTGSKATDLRRGSERLPGRKGKLPRTTYLFTPISYAEFKRKCGKKLGQNSLLTYLLSGGSPIACTELAITGTIPEYVIDLVRDWIEGEITASGRSRSAIINIMNALYRFGSTPIGQAKLARETGLANNTIAANYIEILCDLGCVIPTYPWDKNRHNLILRKECKYHFSNLLVATSYHPMRIRSINDFSLLPPIEQGMWYEWLVAQELLRRRAIHNKEILSPLAFWHDKNHEIDFVIENNQFLEVKRGRTSPFEFTWFVKQFPNKKLTVINNSNFVTDQIQGMDVGAFLLENS